MKDQFLNYISPTVLRFVWSAQVTEGRGKGEATEGKLKARARKNVMLKCRLYSIGPEELWAIFSQGTEQFFTLGKLLQQ